MISKHRRIRRGAVDLLMALMVGTLPVISGLLVMNHLLNRKLEQNSIISAQEAIFAIDRVIDNLHAAALLALPLASQTCTQALPELDAQARRNPRIHSLTLIRADNAFCSTAGAPVHTPMLPAGKHLQLTTGTHGSPDTVLLEYQLPDTNLGVVASAYGLEIRNELRGFQDGLVLLLEFEEQYIWDGGDSFNGPRPSQQEFHETAVSRKYGYRVNAGYPDGFTRREVWQSTMLIAPSLVLIGLLSAAFAYWGVFRKRVRADQR